MGIPVSLGSPAGLTAGGGMLNPAALALLAGGARPPAPHQEHTVINHLFLGSKLKKNTVGYNTKSAKSDELEKLIVDSGRFI